MSRGEHDESDDGHDDGLEPGDDLEREGDHEPDHEPGGEPDREPGAAVRRPGSWTNRIIAGLVVLVGLVAGWFIAVSFLPRWWAQRVGAVSDGSFTAGVFSGLTCGVVFTAIPLVLLRGVFRRRARWGARLTFLVLAALAAVPNLTTLGIVLGSGDAAHAGQRILDVDAPGFRGATLVGAMTGVIGVVALWALLHGRRRRRREVSRLREELRRIQADSDAAAEAPDDSDRGPHRHGE